MKPTMSVQCGKTFTGDLDDTQGLQPLGWTNPNMRSVPCITQTCSVRPADALREARRLHTQGMLIDRRGVIRQRKYKAPINILGQSLADALPHEGASRIKSGTIPNTRDIKLYSGLTNRPVNFPKTTGGPGWANRNPHPTGNITIPYISPERYTGGVPTNRKVRLNYRTNANRKRGLSSTSGRTHYYTDVQAVDHESDLWHDTGIRDNRGVEQGTIPGCNDVESVF